MPSLMAIIGGDAKPLECEFAKIELMAHRVGHSLTHTLKSSLLQTFGVIGMEEMVRRTVEFGEELVNTAARLNVTIEQLQVMRQVAKESGTELDVMVRAFEKLSIAKTTPEGLRALAKLGISKNMLQSQSAYQLFTGPFRGIANSNNPEALAPYLKTIFGKGYGEIMAAMKEDFGEMEAKMRKMGAMMDSETAVKLKALGDQFSMLSRIIVVQLGPALLKLSEFIYEKILKLGKASGGYSDKQRDLDQLDAEAAALRSMRGGGEVGWWRRFNASTDFSGDLSDIFGDDDFDQKAEKAKEKYLKRLYGDEITREVMAGHVPSNAGTKPWEEAEKQFGVFKEELERKAAEMSRPKSPAYPVDETEGKQLKLMHGKLTSLQTVGAYAPAAGVTLIDTAKKSERHLNAIRSYLEHNSRIMNGTAY